MKIIVTHLEKKKADVEEEIFKDKLRIKYSKFTKEQVEGIKFWIFRNEKFLEQLNRAIKILNEGIRESEESFCDCEKPVRDHEYSDCCGRCGDVIKDQNDAERT